MVGFEPTGVGGLVPALLLRSCDGFTLSRLRHTAGLGLLFRAACAINVWRRYFLYCVRVPERLKGADCKSAGEKPAQVRILPRIFFKKGEA